MGEGKGSDPFSVRVSVDWVTDRVTRLAGYHFLFFFLEEIELDGKLE